MGSDWDKEIERGGRPKWWLILVCLAVIAIVLVKCSPSTTDQNPSPKTTAGSPLQTLTTPEPGSTVLGPKQKPPSLKYTYIYVVAPKLSPVWELDSAISGWKLARWTDFRPVAVCPVAKPCVTITEKRLANNQAGVTNFGYDYTITIHLNASLIWDPFKAQSTLAHELGHVLGAPHIVGTNNTLMTAKDGFYRTRPTDLDIRLVDQLGEWELEKMYENSGKTVDVRTAPK